MRLNTASENHTFTQCTAFVSLCTQATPLNPGDEGRHYKL